MGIAGLALAAIAGFGCVDVIGNGQLASDTRSLAGFSGVRNETSATVTIVQASTFSVVVTADSNLLPILTTRVENGVLVIASGEDFFSHNPVTVDVSMPSLGELDSDGSGSVSASGFASGPLALESGGSGALTFQGTAGTVSLTSNGAAQVTLQGSGNRLQATLGGSGELEASQFPLGSCDLTVNGSGGAFLTVNGDVTLTDNASGGIDATLDGGVACFTVNGSGSIIWRGHTTVQCQVVNGSGSVQQQ
jgi:hypothetical protein